MQMKLFETFEDTNITIEELKQEFDEKNIYEFHSKILGITYDYHGSSYVQLLKKVRNFNIRQVIVTSTNFLKLIDYCVENNVKLNQINFIFPVTKESEEIVNSHLEKINSLSHLDKKMYKDFLFKEIDWIVSDECIDIKYISFDIKDNKGLYSTVQLYNNGVLISEESSESLNALIKEIFY